MASSAGVRRRRAEQGGDRVPPGTGPSQVAKEPVVGVIGLGSLGDGMARSVLAAGLQLVVCGVRPEATERYRDEAEVAESPAEVARRADLVIVAVVDDEQVHAVLSGRHGALAVGGPDTVFVVVSTISTECVEAIGAEASAAGVAVVDCGVSGGPAAAASGELVCMVGGDEEVVERARPVLDAIGSLTLVMGPFGSGLAAKLARNLVQYGSWLAAYEGQVLAEAAGIELSKLAEAIRVSDTHIGGASRLMFRTTAAPLTDDDPEIVVTAMRAGSVLAHKDLRAALELARRFDVDLPLAAMTEARCDEVFGLAPPAS
jgi:3-hydroxyisobutyrate dehydrogenase-like beta-hydroxyacid dehydrogenase